MTTPLTSAQSAQQNNRTHDGKYTTKSHSEADFDLTQLQESTDPVIELEDGEVHEIDLHAISATIDDDYLDDDPDPQSALASAMIQRKGDDYFVTGAAYRDFHEAMPEGYDQYGDDGEEIDRYLAERRGVIDAAVADWYGYDDGDSMYSTGDYYEFTHRLDGGAHSEADAIAALRDNTRALDFTEDPDLDDTIREQLEAHDAKKMPNPEQTNARDQREFSQEFSQNLINRLQEQSDDEGLTDDDGEPLELWYAEGTDRQVEAFAAEFYANNEGDLNAYGQVNGLNATIGMTTDHLDYDDGLVEGAHDLESEVLTKRMERSIENELPNFSLNTGHTELSSDGNGREGKVQLTEQAVRDLGERMAAARDELRIAKGKP